MHRSRLFLLILLVQTGLLAAQGLPSGAVLHVRLLQDAKMKVGTPLRAETVEPVYVDDVVAVPAGAKVMGSVVEVTRAPRSRQITAELQGDFTPLKVASVQFDTLMMPSGESVAISTISTARQFETIRIETAGTRPSLMKRLWGDAVGRGHATVTAFSAPGKGSRLKQMLYRELPYHPEPLVAGTEYNVELSREAALPGTPEAALPARPQKKAALQHSVVLHARLLTELSSNSAKAETPVTAVVTEPLFNDKGQQEVPQGTLLLGKVTQARPAKKWGRNGVLRIAFQQLQFPAGFLQQVNGSVSAAQVDPSARLALDAEGGVKAQRPSAAVPLLMGLLATSALGEDESTVGHSAVSSNGFALIGRVIAVASKSHYVGAAFGFFGMARTGYERFIARGAEVTFPHNTAVEISLDPVTSPLLRVR